MTPTRRGFLAGGCAFCAAGLMACTPTSPEGPRPQTGALGADSDLSARHAPGLRTGASDSLDDGLRGQLDAMEARLRTSRAVVRDEAPNAYLRALVRDLAGDYADDIRVYLMRVPEFNATQAPNGMMQIWTGLLARCTNEAQLAAVIGHEIGHYTRAHSRESVRSARQAADVAQVLAMLLGAARVPQLATLSNVALTAGIFGYSRDNEREADELGVRAMVARGLAAGEAAKNWENLTAEMAARGVPRDRALLFATHPSDAERLDTLRRRAAELPAGETRAGAYRAGLGKFRETVLEEQLRAGPHAATILIAERWLGEDSADGLALYAKGEALRLRDGDGDAAKAFETLSAGIAARDTPATAWRALAALRAARGEHAEAQDLLREYLRRAPDAPDREIVRRQLSG